MKVRTATVGGIMTCLKRVSLGGVAMSRAVRFLLFAVAGLSGLIGLVILLAPLWLGPALADRIERAASEAMGMDFKVDGPIRIRLIPGPGVSLTDVHVRNDESEWLRASSMNVRVRVSPLLRGRLEFSDIVLMEPSLELTRGHDGALNFRPDHRVDPVEERRPFELVRFHARGASVTFSDLASGVRLSADACDLAGQDFVWIPAGSPNPGFPDVHAGVTCQQVVYDTLEASGIEAQISVHDRQLKIQLVTGRLFDGRLSGHLESDFSGAIPSHALDLELLDFRVERFVETFRQDRGVEGAASFTLHLGSSGRTLSAVTEGLKGRAELSGTGLVLHGLDLDEQLARYESTQQFNLVDTAALFLAGPAGVAVTRGYGFVSLFGGTGGSSTIRELVSEWNVDGGIALARDVALSTAHNRLALTGGLNFLTEEFDDLRVAVIDADGCAVVEQRILGSFDDPRVERPNFLATLAGPLMDMVERGIALFTETECEAVYTGRVAPP
ncbi:MAG: AsmA family protein [Thioalkalivibrio sp.]